MKAEEFFEKLGYKKQAGFESICYVYENEDTVNFEIIFDLKNKTIHTHGGCTDKSISMDELEVRVEPTPEFKSAIQSYFRFDSNLLSNKELFRYWEETDE